MNLDTVVSSRSDREIRKTVIKPGDYNLVPYEDAKCNVIISEVSCANENGQCDIEPESRYFSSNFDGNITIGDCDNFIDKDFELIVQQMCSGEVCLARIMYNDIEMKPVKWIDCKIELKEMSSEPLVSDWDWARLYNTSKLHKERGVELVKEKCIADAFRRFSKALKLLVAMEPIDPVVIPEATVKEMIELRVKLYNNLAHCQLHYKEYDAAVELCNRTLMYQPDNVKAIYRRSLAYTGLNMLEEAWRDIQQALKLDPNDRAAQQQANILKPRIEKINKDYTNVIRKMFG